MLRDELFSLSPDVLWVFGPWDPEIDELENWLIDRGEDVTSANAKGERVYSHNAHLGTTIAHGNSRLLRAKTLIFVECDIPDITPQNREIIRISRDQVKKLYHQLRNQR